MKIFLTKRHFEFIMLSKLTERGVHMTELPKLTYTLTQAAEAINVSRPTMQQIVNRDDFPAFRTGRRWMIPIEPFKDWLNEQVVAYHQGMDC